MMIAQAQFTGQDEQTGKVIPLPPANSAEEVYYRYSTMVFRLALARCRSRSDAEDVMQEVFMRYVRTRPVLQSAEHQRAWLIRATINCSNSHLSSAWRRHTVQLNDEITSSADPLDKGVTASDVYSAVMRLPKQQRTAVHLFYYEGYKISEIASFTDSSESTVKSWLRRARERLEKDLKGDYFDV